MNSTEKENLQEDSLEDLSLIFSPDEERFEKLTSLACKFFDVPIARISLTGRAYKWFSHETGLESAVDLKNKFLFCSHAIHSENTLVIPDITKKSGLLRKDLPLTDSGIRFYAGHPILFEGKILGTFCIMDNDPREFSTKEIDILQNLASLVEDEIKISMMHSTQTELIRELDEARQQALIDPLTRTWNRRGAGQLLPQELDRCVRSKSPVTVMMIDIDKFKILNDLHGHPFGDTVIEAVAEIIRGSIRPHDIFIRYGGDEFLLFFGNTSAETAEFLSKRILSRIKSTKLTAKNEIAELSISIGMASIAADKDTIMETLIDMADSALYAAKKSGRCCAKKAAI